MEGEYQRIGEALAADGLPTGGPTEAFEIVGRHQFMKLFNAGLLPRHRVLDVGCGCLRGGFFLINFLQQGHYYGIEPNRRMLHAGLERIVGVETRVEKQPRFSNRRDFRLDCFPAARFDFVVARSIWSHASLPEIAVMLDGFQQVGTDDAVFFASYVPTDDRTEEYRGETFSWPAIRYRFETLAALTNDVGLRIVEEEDFSEQRWLRVSR